MREKIDCFLPQGDATVMEEMAAQLQNSKAVQNVIALETGLMSSNALMQVAENAKAEYVLLLTKPVKVTLGQGALDRMLRVASDSNAAMVYSTISLAVSATISISVRCGSSRLRCSTPLPCRQASTTTSSPPSMPCASS